MSLWRFGFATGLASLALVACAGSPPPEASGGEPRALGLALVVNGAGTVGFSGRAVALASEGGTLRVLTEEGVATVTWRLGLDLTRSSTLGLIGGGEVEAPVALYATNGQDLYIADGSRVMRYSDEGLLVQTLLVPSLDRLDAVPVRAAPPGEAVSVASGAEGAVFIAEATRRTVQVWREGQIESLIGGFGDPVGVAVSGRRLFVADREHKSVRVFDTSGQTVGVIGVAEIGGVASVSANEDGILILGPEGVVLYSLELMRLWRVDIESAQPVLDAAIYDGVLFALTSNALTALGHVPPEAGPAGASGDGP